MHKVFLSSILFVLFLGNTLIGQVEVQWLTWEQALEKNQNVKKKFLVDIYTDWCGWCKKMDTRTFKKDNIAQYINENYYAIRFDAEERSDIIFNNKIYKYVAGFGKKGYHELAQEIMNGRMSYPTVVFIDESLNVIQPIPGFQSPSTFQIIMSYFAGNHYMSTPWHKYEKSYAPGQIYDKPEMQPASLIAKP